MREEILYFELPKNAQPRKVTVNEYGIAAIRYSKKKKNKNISIPKPKKLIGGTEPYQKEGLPYWFCRIKDGRDEFMQIYSKDITQDTVLYDLRTGAPRMFITESQQILKQNFLKAICSYNQYGGERWLPVYEPSFAKNGKMQFIAGESPNHILKPIDWMNEISYYSPENHSQMSSVTTYFLLLLRWLRDEIVTLEQLADDSTDIGHFYNSRDEKNDFELTGKRGFGGLYGFIGNTGKLIWSDGKLFIAGGNYTENIPVASIDKAPRENVAPRVFLDAIVLEHWGTVPLVELISPRS